MTIRHRRFLEELKILDQNHYTKRLSNRSLSTHYTIYQARYSVAADMVVGAPELLVYSMFI